MKLVIVESPAKAKTINKYLGADYKVFASYGHVRDLPSKAGSIKPEKNFEMDYEVDAASEKKLSDILKNAKKADEIILATDPDREGEAISWHLLEILKERKLLKKTAKVQRVAFNEITKKAVLNAVANPRDIDMNLVEAQCARRALDYLVGYSISPVLWVKLPGSRSAGRVQSVALKTIVEREKEIADFKIEEYWKINANFQQLGESSIEFPALLSEAQGKKLKKFDFNAEEQVQNFIKQIENSTYLVKDIEKKSTKRNPSPPFTTSSMQQEASRKLGFTARKTMQIAQKLYEGLDVHGENVGLITYMRTDSVNLSADAVKATRGLISKQYGKDYLPEKERFFKSKAKNAQEAHEAIRPTDVELMPAKIKQFLSSDEFKLYDLIWKRVVASQMSQAIVNSVAVFIESNCQKAVFKANGSVIAFPGFYKIYREGIDDAQEEGENLLPEMKIGEKLNLNKIFGSQHFTEPPPRYSEASLVKKLEELGIGRPSTYASIISVIQDRKYARIENKRFFPEDRGIIVTAFLENAFTKYVEYGFTANLEDELDDVAAGNKKWLELLDKFWQGFEQSVKLAKANDNDEIYRKIDDSVAWKFFDLSDEKSRTCPKCESPLNVRVGKYGAFVACSAYPNCDYRRAANPEEAELEFEPKILGKTPLGEEMILKKGPYGLYIELQGDSEPAPEKPKKKSAKKAKPKRFSVPSSLSAEDVDWNKACSLIELPKIIGQNPQTGKDIKVGIGPYGPYIYHNSKFISAGGHDVTEITLEEALTIVTDAASSKSSAAALRVLGSHPEDGKELGIYKGRFGPYIKWNKLNVSLPKKFEVDEISIDEAVELINKKIERDNAKKAKK